VASKLNSTSVLIAMAAMKSLFVVLMCLVAALAAFSSPVEAKGKVNTRLLNTFEMKSVVLWSRLVCDMHCIVASRCIAHFLVLAQRVR
jgi:hypothetical protein